LNYPGLIDVGRATLFRDGQIHRIYWSTVAQAYEQAFQLLHPIHFTDGSSNPIALKPGRTRGHAFTLASVVYEKVPDSGTWSTRFSAPIH